jgi:hypothetical protein
MQIHGVQAVETVHGSRVGDFLCSIGNRKPRFQGNGNHHGYNPVERE